MTVAGEGAEKAQATHHVLRLRAALLERVAGENAAARARREAASRPLVEIAYDPLIRFCERKVQQSGLKGHTDGVDLAHDAWSKVIAYLIGPNGERVQDDGHFIALLNRAALTRLLDLLPRVKREVAASEADALEHRASAWGVRSARTPEDETILLPREGRLDLIAALFRDEEAFRRVNQQRKNARHPRQYQALVLYELGEHYQSETQPEAEAAEDGAALAGFIVDRMADAIGVPRALWEPVRAAAALPPSGGMENDGDPIGDALDARLATAVNEACATNVRDRRTLAVYRYEINQLVEIARGGS